MRLLAATRAGGGAHPARILFIMPTQRRRWGGPATSLGVGARGRHVLASRHAWGDRGSPARTEHGSSLRHSPCPSNVMLSPPSSYGRVFLALLCARACVESLHVCERANSTYICNIYD